MYKKRFAKWGFSKNTRRAPGPQEGEGQGPTRSGSQLAAMGRLRTPRIVRINASEAAQSAFLNSIKTLGLSFFEDSTRRDSLSSLPSLPRKPSDYSTLLPNPAREPPPVITGNDPEQLTFSFKVILGLLQRQQGALAGRLARKAFIEAEALLEAEEPLFIWNALEIFDNIARLREAKLGYMLLDHLISLAGQRPVGRVLRNFRAMLSAWQDDGLPIRKDALERAWALNADLTFSHFDTKYLPLYYRLIWDSNLVKLNPDILQNSEKWFVQARRKVDEDRRGGDAKGTAADMWPEHETAPEGTESDTDPQPDGFWELKTSILAAIRERATMQIPDPNVRLRVLSGLLKSQILEEDDASMPPQASMDTARLQARVMAYLMKLVMQVDKDEEKDVNAAIEKMRTILALREYGEGRAGPRIVYEMWQLEELLLRSGQVQEATSIRDEAYRRLQEFLGDVPEAGLIVAEGER